MSTWTDLGKQIALLVVGEAMAGRIGGRKAKKVGKNLIDLYTKTRKLDAFFDALEEGKDAGQPPPTLTVAERDLLIEAGAAVESIAARLEP